MGGPDEAGHAEEDAGVEGKQRRQNTAQGGQAEPETACEYHPVLHDPHPVSHDPHLVSHDPI